jgi:hypothetical protein
MMKTDYRKAPMKIKEGDVLVCSCGDCYIELTVTKACMDDLCGMSEDCDIEVRCCGKPMKFKTEFYS